MSPEQIIFIGLIASAITFVLRALASYANYHPGRVVINIGLYVVSAGLAFLWSGAVAPTFPSFDSNIAVFIAAVWAYLNEWIALAAPIMGSASLIYNLLYEKVVMPLWARFAKGL